LQYIIIIIIIIIIGQVCQTRVPRTDLILITECGPANNRKMCVLI